jgi:uncharacterized protein YecT (DUF1311 family)
MKKLLLLVGLAALAFPAAAQYKGPAVEACRAYAKRQAAKEGTKPLDIVFLQDQALLIERYDQKLGAQHVSSVLTGNGSVVFPAAPSAELSFICLLADEKRPLFFNWLPRQNVSVLAQCTRAPDLKGKTRPCLELLHRVAEMDVTQVYAVRFQEANESGEAALAVFRKSNDEWRQYRDAECARRKTLAPKGVRPEDFELACIVELTRRRGLDMR